MSTTNHLDWQPQEFQTYLLLYCASIDTEQSNEELDFIKEKLSIKEFKDIEKSFNKDSDFQSLTKIQEYVTQHQLSENEIKNSLKEVSTLFKIDGHYDQIERHLLQVLKSLLA